MKTGTVRISQKRVFSVAVVFAFVIDALCGAPLRTSGQTGKRIDGDTLPATAQLGDTWVNPKDGAVMVYIPAGTFQMGDDDEKENPRHQVRLSDYWIYKNPVTVAMYKKFCADTGSKMPPVPHFNANWSKDNHPIVNVTWNQATAYCKWAGVKLPTEAQWEKAARGADGRKYPWGNDFDQTKLWSSAGNKDGGTTAVGTYGVSPYGCTDMAGNAWQWCRDWFDPNFWARHKNETDPENQNEGDRQGRCMRGGSWTNRAPATFRAADRFWYIPTDYIDTVGFRGASGPK